jgi:hypothetical protein
VDGPRVQPDLPRAGPGGPGPFGSLPSGAPAGGALGLGTRHRRLLHGGRGWDQPVAGAAHRPDLPSGPGRLLDDRGAGEGIHGVDARPGDRGAGGVPVPGPLAVLHLLGIHPGAHDAAHRDLGRPAAGVCGGEVLPLHDGRLGVHAGGHRGPLAPLPPADRDGDLRSPMDGRAAFPAARPGGPALALSGLRAGLRHQGTHVALPFVAPGRPCGGPDGRVGDLGRPVAEDGRLRVPAVELHALPGRGSGSRSPHRHPGGGGYPLRGPGLLRPGGLQAPGGLLQRLSYGVRDAGAFRPEPPGGAGGAAPDGQPRSEHRGAVPAGGDAV